MMNHNLDVTVAASLPEVMDVISNLETYPDWIDFVSSVEANASDDQSYLVTLKARLGPIARSKKLRMVQVHDPENAENTVVFERQETHGRQVSNWRMQTTASRGVDQETTELSVNLSYDGDLWTPLLETIMNSQTKTVHDKLTEYLRSRR